MRKTLLALATATTITFAGIPNASAQTDAASSDLEQSSQQTSSEIQQGSSSVVDGLEKQWDWATEGVDMLSSGSPIQGTLRVISDWVLGTLAVTAIGSLIVTISNASSNF